MPLDKKAFILYILTSIVLWQFGISFRDLCIKPDMQFLSANNPLFSFVYMKNTGGAFSIFHDKTNFLIIFGIFVVIFLLIYAYKKLEFSQKFKILVLISLTAGVLGNLVERLENGYVIDFIKLNFIDFAVFNFFDILITTSVILLLFYIIFEEIKKRAK